MNLAKFLPLQLKAFLNVHSILAEVLAFGGLRLPTCFRDAVIERLKRLFGWRVAKLVSFSVHKIR